MNRIFWIGVGVALTIVVAQKIREAAKRPGVAAALDATRSAQEATAYAKGFVGEFKSAMAQREADLRTQLLNG